jgi:uncharacterized Zn finger protein
MLSFMSLYIPHLCPICFESVTLVQPQQNKGGAFKGLAKAQCLNCGNEQEYDLTKPVNGRANLTISKRDVRFGSLPDMSAFGQKRTFG